MCSALRLTRRLRSAEPTQEALKKGFSEARFVCAGSVLSALTRCFRAQLQLSIVSVDPALVKARHGNAKVQGGPEDRRGWWRLTRRPLTQ